ncbi:MAG: energy transducer TonB [Ignavibacteriaceae bacterium]|nr:energy transducer TonB [Ignavibacterium sp.]MCC6253425.1 energy transducer TonB [Ignavibacteriaceae bacterium]HMN23751.1 energy transducer TonB [Ignavibacteriaceae bacterium]HRN26979.1 energy transducer TonB [Ignavibacteriaceae bacterium]HRP92005.1 energy transducer TonB [Ignavibacteriaceae bacterium]
MKAKKYLGYLYTLILIVLLSKVCFSQNTPAEDDQYLAFATTMPELDGGMAELSKKIKYPSIAKQTNTEGKVYAMAYVDDKGNVDKVKIIKGLGAGCDEEVVRVLSTSKFKPGQHEGKTVKVKTTISVVFKLK